MRKLLITIACCYSLAFVFTPRQSAENDVQNRQPDAQDGVDSLNERANQIDVTLGDIVELSETSVVATSVEYGIVYAVGVRNDAVFKTQVLQGASQAFGISLGTLAFSKRTQGSDREGLFIADLRTYEQQSLFPEHSVLRAQWRPRGRSLAAILSRGSENDLFCMTSTMERSKPSVGSLFSLAS